MARIQSSIGLITGTDITGTVDQLMAINALPRDRLLTRTQTLQAEQSSLDELTASVIGVQFAGTQLSNLSTFRSKSSTSSNSEALSVVAGSKANAATHEVRTIQTAATHTVRSRDQFESDSEALGLTGTIKVTPDGFLDQSASLSSLNNGRGVDSGSIRITDRSGSTAEVDLSSAQTIDDVIQAINDASIDVAATTVGGKIQLTDQTGSSDSNLIVEQLGNDETAADLGLYGIDEAADTVTGFDLTFNVDADTDLSQLRQGKGVRLSDGADLSISLSDGTNLDVDFGDFGGADQPTIEDVVDQLNAVDPSKFSASFTENGIEVVDLTTGTETFSISNASDSKTASDLGLVGSTSSSDTITAEFDKQVLRGTSLDKLSGGSGLENLTTLDVTTADGNSASIDLSSATNTAEVIDAINQSGLALTARLDDSGTGLRLRDVSGGTGNFVISSADDTADLLGIAANTEDDIVNGVNLNKQTVTRDTLLSSLRDGLGIDDGSFTITDSNGSVGAVNIAADEINSVGDLIDRINSLSVDVVASLSESGDGITLVDNGGGSDTLTVKDTGTGTTASDLGIAGEATDQVVDGATVSALAGTQADVIQIEATDTLASIVEKLNASENYVTASVELNDDGTYGLRVRSNKGGEAGRFGLIVDGLDLQLDTTAQAQDAKIAVSTDGGSERLLSSSDGVFDLNGSDSSSATITASTQLSEFASGATSGSFTVTDSDGVVSAINITVQEIETVGDLVEAFNDLGLGIEASINEDGTGISIIDTAGGSETLTIEDVGNGIAAASLGIDGEADEETVDGVTVTALVGSGQGSEEDEATGLTFTLKDLSSETITVNVTEDASAITSAATTFVNQYNSLVDKLESLTFFDGDTNEIGLLFGSSEAQRIRTGYSRLLSGVIAGAGNIKTVGQVGISFNDQGKLDLDTSKLADAVEDSREDVESFFTTTDNGLADRLDTLAESIAGVDSGLLLNRRATLTAQVESNFAKLESLDEQLDNQRERLLTSFYRTEEAISKLQSNSSALDQIQYISL